MNTGTRYWAANIVAALVILVALGVHLGLIHLDGLLGLVNPAWADSLAWDRVVRRGESAWVTTSYVVLVGAALFHGLYGLHTILTELWDSPRAAARIATGCWATGIVLFTVGATAVLVFHFGLTGS
jgi:succinate dehydrogenase hydrophobic anchor subunit